MSDNQERKDWLVSCYGEVNGEDRLLLGWEIKNRTEAEAMAEAEKDIAQMSDVEDWTLSPLRPAEG